MGFGRVGGQHDDGRAVQSMRRLVRPDQADRGQPVHHRHLHVHQDHVVPVPQELIHALAAVVRGVDLEAQRFQQTAHNHLIGRIVLDHQNPQSPVRRFGVVVGSRVGRCAQPPDRHDDGEQAALARRRPRGDLAAHQLSQRPADRQPQAGAAKLARNGVVCLDEGIEQALRRLRIKADPGVLHLDPQPLALGPGRQIDPHVHRAFRRELDRVGHQIGHDLRDPHAVAQHLPVGSLREAHRQGHAPFLGRRGPHLDHGGDVGAQVEGRGSQTELARLHLRQVQHVVQHAPQGIARAGDQQQHLRLPLGQGRVRQGRGQTEDGVQGRSHLMTDVGEESVPHLGRAPRLFLRDLQRLQRPDVIGNLETDGRIGLGPPILARIRHDGRVDPVQLAVLVAVLDRAPPHPTAGDGPVEVLEERTRVMTGVDQPVVLADQFVAAVAADVDELLIAVQNLAGAVRDGHDRRLVQSPGQARATRPVNVSH